MSSDNGPNGANQPTARHSDNIANTASGHAKGRHCLSAGSRHPCLVAAMARADLLIDSVRAGAECNQELFRRALEALISGGRSKEHHVLADRLAAHLQLNGHSKPTAAITPVSLNGASRLLLELRPQRRLEVLLLPATVLQACSELIEEHHRTGLLRGHNLDPRHRLHASCANPHETDEIKLVVCGVYTICSRNGIASQVRPSSNRPVAFFRTPPHCLKKKATPSCWQ